MTNFLTRIVPIIIVIIMYVRIQQLYTLATIPPVADERVTQGNDSELQYLGI